MVNLKQLQAFVWVADLGSFRQAAERLNTTQPNISARIAVLETTLGVTLMERDAGSVRLTSKGVELLNHARRVLFEVDGLVAASNNATLVSGSLKLGVTEIVVNTWLRDFLKAFKERYSNVTVELTVDISTNLTRELVSRSIDLAFQNGPFNSQTSGNEALGSYPLIWVASPTIAASFSAAPDVQQMAQFPILTHARGTQPYEQVVQHFAHHREANAHMVPSSNLAACLHMTIDGMGIASLPTVLVAAELANGELEQIPYTWQPDDLLFAARYDLDKSPSLVGEAAQLAGLVAGAFAERRDKE